MRILTTTALAALLTLGAITAVPSPSHAQFGFGVGISVGFAPPPLPIYDQPPIPDYGYMWIPGYWAWDPEDEDYYWVPGTWVLPPEEGLLWTPAWWGWSDGAYVFHPGYWAPHIGYYGGIDYGFGYDGYGYQGGYWRGREFFYNRSVNNVRGIRPRNIFERPVLGERRGNRVSYSGGMGGVMARPTLAQLEAMREHHIAPTPVQIRHAQMAGADRSLGARENRGRPPIAATPAPGGFGGSHGPPPGYRAGGERLPSPEFHGQEPRFPQGFAPGQPAQHPPVYPGAEPGERREPGPPPFNPPHSRHEAPQGFEGAHPPGPPVGSPPVFHPGSVGPGGYAPPHPAPPPPQPHPQPQPHSPPPPHGGRADGPHG